MAIVPVDVETLFKRYGGVVYDRCVAILHDRAEAEDAVQETFVLVHRHADRFRYGDSYLPWLYRIATNVCLKVLRTRSRKGAVLDPEAMRAASVSEYAPERIDMQRAIATLARRLDERNFAILVGHFVDGMSQEEIAEHLGISRRAVVKRLTALRAKLGLKEPTP